MVMHINFWWAFTTVTHATNLVDRCRYMYVSLSHTSDELPGWCRRRRHKSSRPRQMPAHKEELGSRGTHRRPPGLPRSARPSLIAVRTRSSWGYWILRLAEVMILPGLLENFVCLFLSRDFWNANKKKNYFI